jgi:hypothetical protein
VGTHSTAGGFVVSPLGTPGGGFQSVTQLSTPSGRRGWRVVSGAEQTNPVANLTASVRCERKIDGRIIVRLTGSDTIAPGFAVNFNFRCPPGTHPLGGGWSVDAPFDGDLGTSSNLIVIQNRRTSPTTWLITAEVRSGAPNPSTFRPTVPCERNSRRRITERGRVVPLADNTRASASATCARGRHVVSGGFVLTPLPGTTPAPVPFAPMDYNAPTGGRTWRADVYDTVYAAPAGSALTTYAYCRRNRLRRKRRPRRSAAATSAPIGSGTVEISPPVPVLTLAG